MLDTQSGLVLNKAFLRYCNFDKELRTGLMGMFIRPWCLEICWHGKIVLTLRFHFTGYGMMESLIQRPQEILWRCPSALPSMHPSLTQSLGFSGCKQDLTQISGVKRIKLSLVVLLGLTGFDQYIEKQMPLKLFHSSQFQRNIFSDEIFTFYTSANFTVHVFTATRLLIVDVMAWENVVLISV